MHKFVLGCTILSLVSTSPCWGVNLMQFTQDLPVNLTSEERGTLLNVFTPCGQVTNIDDYCVTSGLEALVQKDQNPIASTMLTQYQATQAMGQADKTECQLETHRKSNRVVGHCLFRMYFAALETQDAAEATEQYQFCLMSSMLALTYQGNIVAQYFLSQLYDQGGQGETGLVWKRALSMRQETEEYKALSDCYGGVSF